MYGFHWAEPSEGDAGRYLSTFPQGALKPLTNKSEWMLNANLHTQSSTILEKRNCPK